MRPLHLAQPPPGADADDSPYPTVVVEVGVSESTGSLHNLAPEYFGARTTIRAYIAVKIWPRRPNGTFAALALLYIRGNVPNTTPVQAVSFGTAKIHQTALNTMPPVIPPLIIGHHGPAPQFCNALNLSAFQITVPVNEVYHGVPGGLPAGAAPPNLIVDLFQVQKVAYV